MVPDPSDELLKKRTSKLFSLMFRFLCHLFALAITNMQNKKQLEFSRKLLYLLSTKERLVYRKCKSPGASAIYGPPMTLLGSV